MAQSAATARRSTFSRAAQEKQSIRTETTKDGRYIPHNGGLMGWFENSGVLKRELPNNYLFHTVIDAAAVRRKLFQRWGGGENVSRRVSERHEATRQVDLTILHGDKSLTAAAKDYSTHGLRLQLQGGEDPGLAKGEAIRVQIMDAPEGGEVLFDIESTVMWINTSGRRLIIRSIGVAFEDMEQAERDRLRDYFQKT